MDLTSALALFNSHGLDLNKPKDVLDKTKLISNFMAAKTKEERRKVFKTVLRSVLPFPFSLAAGEILVQLVKAVPEIRRVIDRGIRL